MLRMQTIRNTFFLLAYSASVCAGWSQEVIQPTNIQFLDFSSEASIDPFAIKISQSSPASNSKVSEIVQKPVTTLDPIIAWRQSFSRLETSGFYNARYPMIIYYPVPVYYPIYYPVYAPYYFN